MVIIVITCCMVCFGCGELHRGHLMEIQKQLKQQLQQDPNNKDIRFNAAKVTYQLGDFREAKELLMPLYNEQFRSPKVSLLMGRLEYLFANYEKSEEILFSLINEYSDRQDIMETALEFLLLTYYQTNNYTQLADLVDSNDIGGNFAGYGPWAKSFGEEAPYQIEWNGQTETSTPFYVVDPLPVLMVEVNGEEAVVILDTGGDAFLLDKAVGDRLDIKAVSSFIGGFAGGLEAEVGLAKADSIKIGDVTIKNAPIHLLDFTDILPEPVVGILGTRVLKQFLSTLDYKNSQLILRKKTVYDEQTLKDMLNAESLTEVPFVLSSTHYIMAKGSLNNKKNLTWFVDSGLGSEEKACMESTIQTLLYAGIPVPVPDTSGVGGGGEIKTAIFPADEVGLGTLKQANVKGEYGGMTPEAYWEHGFIMDGIISHRFFRQYDSWTIDFSRMQLIFVTRSR